MPVVSVRQIRRWAGRVWIEVCLVTLLCLLAFAGAAWTSASVFERLPHTEDETAFLFQAQTIASGDIIARAPAYPDFFSVPFVIVRDGLWFGKYPPGFPAVLAIGVAAGAPWIVNATLASLCVLATFLFARRLYGRSTGLLAAALLATSPFFLLQAGSLLSHIASMFFGLIFLALYPLARNQQGWALPAVTGMAIGMLFLTRPLTAVGIAIPYIVWTLATIVRQRRLHRSYLYMIAGAAPFVLAYLSFNDITTGSPLRTAYELWWDFDRLGFGPDIGINGHDLGDGLRNTQINANSLARFLYSWPGRGSLVPAVVAVLVSLAVLIGRLRHRRHDALTRARHDEPSPEAWDLILASVVLSLVAAHILYWTPGQMYGPRYYMEAVGLLAMLSARGLVRVALAASVVLQKLAPSVQRPAFWGYAVVFGVAVALTAYAYLGRVPAEYDRFRGWNDITGENLAIVEAANLENALVFIERETWTDYAPFFAQNMPSLDTDIVYASDRGTGANRILMDHYPGRDYYLFADGELIRLTR